MRRSQRATRFRPAMHPELGCPVEVLHPEAGLTPLVLSSPHSGRIYPPCLMDAVGIPFEELRRLEDGCVDRLFTGAPALGAPLLRARFARAYVDPNRDAFELDQEMFGTPLPPHARVGSLKARAGLGVIPSRLGGRQIYRRRLSYDEAERRIELAYVPYHHALQRLVDRPLGEFGTVILLDCHSMPSQTADGGRGGEAPVDVALGDRYGRSCASVVIERAATLLRRAGLRVGRNRPYAGGQITTRYGRPERGRHALQIEVRRDLFMDETTLEPSPGLAPLSRVFENLLLELCALGEVLRPAERRPVYSPAAS
jgi:N-formylglutamate amidohydrolase